MIVKLESVFIDRLASGRGLSGHFLMVRFGRRVLNARPAKRARWQTKQTDLG